MSLFLESIVPCYMPPASMLTSLDGYDTWKSRIEVTAKLYGLLPALKGETNTDDDTSAQTEDRARFLVIQTLSDNVLKLIKHNGWTTESTAYETITILDTAARQKPENIPDKIIEFFRLNAVRFPTLGAFLERLSYLWARVCHLFPHDPEKYWIRLTIEAMKNAYPDVCREVLLTRHTNGPTTKKKILELLSQHTSSQPTQNKPTTLPQEQTTRDKDALVLQSRWSRVIPVEKSHAKTRCTDKIKSKTDKNKKSLNTTKADITLACGCVIKAGGPLHSHVECWNLHPDQAPSWARSRKIELESDMSDESKTRIPKTLTEKEDEEDFLDLMGSSGSSGIEHATQPTMNHNQLNEESHLLDQIVDVGSEASIIAATYPHITEIGNGRNHFAPLRRSDTERT
jgi:hypothetical protein